ncbi:Exocyst complex component [Nymphaea thermarum]|nr:Exocyst complex component [Nymphaea thermarum]
MLQTVSSNLFGRSHHMVKVSDTNSSMAKDAVNNISHHKGIGEIEERISCAEETILGWGTTASVSAGQSMIWNSKPEEASEYLQVVSDVQKLMKSLESMSLTAEVNYTELLRRSSSVLETAMVRLEEEFSHILQQNKQPLETELLSFRSGDGDVSEEDSSSSFDDYPVDDSQVKVERLGDFTIHLINPSAILDLRCIADLMLQSDYDQECCKAYSRIRKDALDESLLILGVEKLSIDEVERMEWESLDSHIRKWIRAMKTFVRVVLASEKHLCNQIFGEQSLIGSTCFLDAAKGATFQVLKFGDAIAISRRLPEKLLGILGMYDVLEDLLPDIDSLFWENEASFISTEAHEVLLRLGESVKGTFMEFSNAIERNVSTSPFPRGGIHPLTKYVMNYIKALIDYKDTLDCLLEVKEDDDDSSVASLSPTAQNLLEVVSILEANLEAKSRLYRDDALRNFFLMNNIHYMVEKVKDSDLCLLGEDWIRRHNRKVQLYATTYERASWSTILSCLKDEGINLSGSSSNARAVLRERFKAFNLSFEDIYKAQTSWIILNPQLRDELRISISLKVLQAYRMFIGRYGHHLEGSRHADRYIKYTADDLENLLLDLFEGSPRSLNSQRSRR